MTTKELLRRLEAKARRGSKPRCHLLTYGKPQQVANRITDLIKPWGRVDPTDKWMPQGFEELMEAQLHNAPRLLNVAIGESLEKWWLAVPSGNAKTPNWDIACTCVINGTQGLVLIEAKAHDNELDKESGGKPLKLATSENSRKNHEQIGECILKTNDALSAATRLDWKLSRDSRYQMSNRFAWAWKVASLGIPVVLVYLGFLKANEMSDKGNPFQNAEEWENVVKEHCRGSVPEAVWGKPLSINGTPMIALIRCEEQTLDDP